MRSIVILCIGKSVVSGYFFEVNKLTQAGGASSGVIFSILQYSWSNQCWMSCSLPIIGNATAIMVKSIIRNKPVMPVLLLLNSFQKSRKLSSQPGRPFGLIPLYPLCVLVGQVTRRRSRAGISRLRRGVRICMSAQPIRLRLRC